MATHSIDQSLRQRANRVIPGGMYGHMAMNSAMPANYPQFFSRAQGCRLWDVDGNEYIDFMCSYGPMIAGYGNERIRAAADRQRNTLDIANGPPQALVELAEKFTQQISHASWAVFAKNGNDATTFCNMIARAHTGRKKVLVGSTAYHGSQPWANRRAKNAPEEEFANYPTYEFNNTENLRQVVAEHDDDIAGIVVSAYKHDVPHRQEAVDLEFARTVRELCDQKDALLILDDVRAGLRLSLDASWSSMGIQQDLSCWGKAIANGEPLAAVLGNESTREATASLFFTGSFWYQGAPFAASLETLDLLNEMDAPKRLEVLGQQFRDGLYEQAQRHGFGIHQSGPPQMPLIEFEDDPKKQLISRFCERALEQGVYLHPWHNMFLSIAHTETDIAQALEATDAAFSQL